MKNNVNQYILCERLKPSVALAVSALMAGCGGNSASTSSSSSLSASLSGLDKIPNASSMVAANSSSASKNQILSKNRSLAHDRAVSGTPPLVTSLSSSNVDQYFYNGLIAKITAPSWSSSSSLSKQADANSFFGQTDGGASGQSGCNMVAGLAQSFRQLLQNTNSTCYMKRIPTAAGVTVTGSAVADVWTQTGKDKIVEAKIKNMTQGGNNGGGTMDMNVFIVLSGKNSVGSDVYKAHLYMCPKGSAHPNQDEVITIKYSTGEFTDISNQSQNGGGVGYSKATGVLSAASGGAVVWDSTQPRTVDSYYSDGGSNVFKSKVVINSDNSITTQSYNNGSWGSGKNYSIANFSGTSLKDLAFSQGGFSGSNHCPASQCGSTYDSTFTSGVEYRSTFYAAAPSSALATSARTGFQTALSGYLADSALTVSAFDFSQDDCSVTPDIVVDADFSTAPLLKVQSDCEGETKLMDDIWQICQGSSVNQAFAAIMSNYQGH